MSDEDLAYLPAVAALRLFARRELSPVELMRAVIARAERTEPVVNALAERLFDEALDGAREAEARYAPGARRPPRPLEGLPVAAKELHAMTGRPLTNGSLLPSGDPPTENAPVIDRVLEAGGIIHARTTQPEFGVSTYTHSRLWGVTRNPWQPEYSPGGSSGGAAASLAAGSTTLATASDIGGSIRIPAAFTGLVGFKPPHGRVAAAGIGGADTYRADGPMARTVADCALLQNVLCGPDSRDHHALRPAYVLPDSSPPVTGMRLALCVRLGDYQVHPEVEKNTRAAAAALAGAGAVVEEITLPWTVERLLHAVAPHFATRQGAAMTELADAHADLLMPYTLRYAEQMREVRERADLLYGLRGQVALQRELAEATAGFDALVCPTTTVPVFRAGDDMLDGCVLDGTDYGPWNVLSMTLPFNMAGNCPVLTVPSGWSSYGVPTGVQIVGRTFDDATAFRVGRALEELMPDPFAPERRPRL
ncbi:amidase [Streptomyces sp. NPDC058812]|uniref:amidase n=1 Tax=unclassified Streptomyces TaxID=2593676 RepID=UPI0036744FF8